MLLSLILGCLTFIGITIAAMRLAWLRGGASALAAWDEERHGLWGTFEETNAWRDGWPPFITPDYPVDGPHRKVPQNQPGWLGTYGETLQEREEKMVRVKPREGNVKILVIDVGEMSFIMHRGVPLDPAEKTKLVVNTKDRERVVMHLRDLADKLAEELESENQKRMAREKEKSRLEELRRA